MSPGWAGSHAGVQLPGRSRVCNKWVCVPSLSLPQHLVQALGTWASLGTRLQSGRTKGCSSRPGITAAVSHH